MKEFHRAFKEYWRDHSGADPSSPLLLYPRYLSSVDTFVCPAYHSSRFTLPVSQRVRFADRIALNTYFFPYLEMRDPDMRLQRNRVPLVVCRIHSELIYEDAYQQLPRGKTTRDKKAFVQRYGVPMLLVLGRDGEVRFFSALDRPDEGLAYVDFDLTSRPSTSGRRKPQSVRTE